MKTQTTRMALLAVLMIAMVLMALPAAAQKVLRVNSQDSYILTGKYKDTLIQLSDIENLEIKNLDITNCRVQLAGCRNQKATGYNKVRGGSWDSFPSPVKLSDFDIPIRWAEATNGATTWIGDRQKYRRIFPGGDAPVQIVVDRDMMKNNFSPEPYARARWILRDAAGKTFYPQFWKMDEGKDTLTIHLKPGGKMAAGLGFWSVVNPAARTNIDYSGFDVRDHLYFSMYFANIKIKDSVFGPSTLDYNAGSENTGTAELDNVVGYGNHSPAGNGASFAFLFGADSITVKNCKIDGLNLTSGGWPFGPITSNNNMFMLDWETGWYVGPIKVEGITRVPIIPTAPVVPAAKPAADTDGKRTKKAA